MPPLFRAVFALAVVSVWAGTPLAEESGLPLDCTVVSLRRQDLPDGFPNQVFEEGFAVLEVHITNRSGQDLRIEPDRIEIFNARGKGLKTAQPSEMAPRLVKYYVRGGTGSGVVHGEARSGYPYPPDPNRARYESVRTIGPPAGDAGHVDAGTGPALRAELEAHQLKATLLEAGAELQGYLYIKSKKGGPALAGGYIVTEGQRFGF